MIYLNSITIEIKEQPEGRAHKDDNLEPARRDWDTAMRSIIDKGRDAKRTVAIIMA